MVIDCSQNSVSTIKTNWKPSLKLCQLGTEVTCNVLSYRDLLIIKLDGNPWKLAKPSFNIKLQCTWQLQCTWWSLLAKLISKSYMVENHNFTVSKFQVIGETNKKRLYYPQKPVKSKTSHSSISSWSSSLGWKTSSLINREYTERFWWCLQRS